MDKATPTLRERSDVALRCLPDSPYRTMLAALFDEMLAEVERLAAQAAPILGDKQVCASNVDDKAAPVVQAGEYPPLPEDLFSEFWGRVAVWDLSAEGEDAGAEAIRIENVVKGLMRAYVDADRAARQALRAHKGRRPKAPIDAGI